MDKALLDLYSDYLISSFSATTATGLSTLLNEQISHDQITRFLAGEKQTGAALWQLVKPLVRQMESAEGVLIIDDSIEEKPYTDENEIVCWHWDHAKARNVKGINFITALYHSHQVSLPVTFVLVAKTESYVDNKSGKSKRRSPVSKNEHCRQMLQSCVANHILFRFVLMDIWFASATTQTNHFFAALAAFVKLEMLKVDTRLNHSALKTAIYIKALQTAFQELKARNPISFAQLSA